MKTLSITYLTYNRNGTELLANLSGEQIYLFDVNKSYSTYKYNSILTMYPTQSPSTSSSPNEIPSTSVCDKHKSEVESKNGFSKQLSNEDEKK